MAKKPTGKKPQKKGRKSTPKKKAASSSSPKQTPSSAKASFTLPPYLQQALTHVGIILAFLVLCLAYFQPITQGRVLQMADIQRFAGTTQEVRDFRESTGEEAFWTNSMFGGMPTYHAGLNYPNNWINNIRWTYFSLVPNPISFVLLLFMGFYLLLNVLGCRPGVAAIGGIAFAFSTFFFISLKAGHSSKIAATAFMAPVVAGVILAYRGKIFWGAVIAALATAFQISSNHFQITYYLIFILIILAGAFFVQALQEKTLPQFFKTSGILVAAALLGAAPNYGMLTTTLEYADETIRGQSELSPEEGERESSGLDKTYALGWSLGQAETFTLMIPNFHGGPTVSEIDRDTEAFRVFQQNRVVTYWGEQPFTEGPTYAGAIICFLFVLGIMLVKGPLKWTLVIATALSILLAWGKNLEWFTDIFFYNVPMYNKFRAVTMALTIANLTMPFLAMLGLHQVIQRFQKEEEREALGKQILIAGGITGGLSLLFWLVGPSFFSFSGPRDAGQPEQALDILRDLRIDMFRSDALRSLGLIATSAGILWLYTRSTLKLGATLTLLGILILGDMWMVNKRYLGKDEFGRQKLYTKPAPSPADQFILQDTDLSYRVLNLSSGDPFQDPNTSFFHKSIGGYHPAKLRRYNDVISQYLQPGIQRMAAALQASPTDSALQAALAKEPGLNMVNTRYIILQENQRPARNQHALGNAWFVNGVQQVENPDEEFAALANLQPRQTAIVDKRYADQLNGLVPSVVGGEISLTSYSPNELVYTSKASSEKIAVFSEVYYNEGKGWQAYIDDEPVPHFRANYILRAMRVPAGEHTITFKMEPQTYYRGETLALISSIILLALFVGLVGYGVWNGRKES